MNLNELIPAETKKIDVSEYFKSDEPITIEIKHYSNWQRGEILALMTSGQEYDQTTNKVIFKNTGFQNELFRKELLYGVAKTPFGWDEKIIKEIDDKNPELLAYIHAEVEGYNIPFEPKKSGKSGK